MSQILSVVSGKGGVGKSTVCAYVADAMRAHGSKTLILELDFGLRGLDIMLGVEDQVVYDANDVLSGAVELTEAVVTCANGVDLLAAASTPDVLSDAQLRALLNRTSDYDVVLIDNPAGIAQPVLTMCDLSDTVMVVTTPDPVCVRDAGRAVRMLGKNDHCRLLINRVDVRHRKNNPIRDFDAILDDVGVPLLGVIPDDPMLKSFSAAGKYLAGDGMIVQVFNRISERLSGKHVPLLVG